MLVHRVKWLLSAALIISVADARNISVPGDYKTIGEALANADAGDTIRVARGTYNENVTLVQGVTLLGDNPLNTIIDGGRSGPTVYGVAGGVIKNFTIRNGIEGVLCENAPAVIENNWVIDNHASGIAAFISLPSIANNVVYGNRWSGILIWGAKSYDSRIEQNVVVRNGFSGLSLMGPSNVNIRNNIFLENLYYGIFAENASGMSKVEYNDIYRNYFPFNKYVTVPRSNFNVDPKLTEFSLFNPNYFVSSRSPLKERGKGECGSHKCDIGLVDKLPSNQTAAPEPEEKIEKITLPVAKPVAPVVAAPAKGGSVNIQGINFKTGSSDLTPESELSLQSALDLLTSIPDSKFEVRGHTDNKGDRTANQKLSESRAKAVVTWLVGKGIAASRLTAKGLGDTKPIANNNTEDGRAQNRRIEFYRVQ